MNWKFELLHRLRSPKEPRVLTRDALLRMAQAIRPSISERGFSPALKAFEHIGAIGRVTDKLILNYQCWPRANLAEAAEHIRPGAFISLHYHLGEMGTHNNPSRIITCVVPRKDKGQPAVERVSTESGCEFSFYALDPRFFPVEATEPEELRDLAIHTYPRCPTFTAEASLLQWIHLARQAESGLCRPPHHDIEFEMEPDGNGAVFNPLGLRRSRLLRLAELWGLSEPLNAWLTVWQEVYDHQQEYEAGKLGY